AAGDGIAVQHRDGRIAATLDAVEDGDHAELVIGGDPGLLCHLLEVHAGAEGGTGAAHEDHADVGSLVEALEAETKPGQQGDVHRVALVGTIQRDGGDAVGHAPDDLIAHRLVAVPAPR